jgi:hypothetical protein
MATTTNYGWTTPDDTALVKDGASAIRTLGSSVDTTTKNLNPETTLGDLSFRSSTSNVNTRIPIGSSGQHLTVVAGVPAWSTASDQTPLTTKGDLFTFSTLDARLGVGTNTHVLTADSAEATGLKWAAPSSGAMTKITSASFSNVATVSVDNCFTSTYKNYIVRFSAYNETSEAADFYWRFRNSTPSTITSGYSAGAQRIIRSGTITQMASDNATQLTLTTDMGGSANEKSGFQFHITGFTASTERPNFSFIGSSSASSPYGMFCTGGGMCDASNIKGFILSASTGNITGDYQVYGLEN